MIKPHARHDNDIKVDSMKEDSVTEDSVTVKAADIIIHGSEICAQCHDSSRKPRTTVECEPVPVSKGAKNDSVLVPRYQLAMLQKYYMAVKDVYHNYALTDGDSKEVVRKLLEQTPEVLSAVNERGQSPIESALTKGHWAAGAQLLELAGRKNTRAVGRRMASGQDALMLAIAGGSESTVRQLIELGRSRDVCFHYNSRGQNSLHLCALGSSSGILELVLAELAHLLSKGQLTPQCVTAALTTNDCDGNSPVHYMARNNQVQMLRAVLELSQGSQLSLDWDLNQTAGSTPLAAAAEADSIDACEFLLRRGLAGIDLAEQRDLWMQARLSGTARTLLAQHCPLLGPMSSLPPDILTRLQDELQKRKLTDEFLMKLRTRWPSLPQLPSVVAVLTVCQNFSGSCRLNIWDILTELGNGDLARLLEAEL